MQNHPDTNLYAAVPFGVGEFGAGDAAADPRYNGRNTRMPPLSCATSLTNFVKFDFFSSVVRNGVKWWMQSLVVAFGACFNHSTNIQSSNSPFTGTATCDLRFFGLGTPVSPSSALRLLLFDLASPIGGEADPTVGD